MIRLSLSILLIVLLAVLTACAQSSPADAMVKYLQARVSSDVNALTAVSCSEWEAQARRQADSFKSMNAELEGVTCSEDGKDGDYTVVKCDGKIITTYNGEQREWPLGRYRMIQENGDWKMCGEAS